MPAFALPPSASALVPPKPSSSSLSPSVSPFYPQSQLPPAPFLTYFPSGCGDYPAPYTEHCFYGGAQPYCSWDSSCSWQEFWPRDYVDNLPWVDPSLARNTISPSLPKSSESKMTLPSSRCQDIHVNGLPSLHEQGTSNSLEDDQSQEKFIKKTGTVNLEQRWQKEGVTRLLNETNVPCHGVVSHNVDFNKDVISGSQERSYKYSESSSTGIVGSAHSSSVKNSVALKNGHLASFKNTTAVTGWEGGSTNRTVPELMAAQTSVDFSTSKLEEKDNCAFSVNETKFPLSGESNGTFYEEVVIDGVQNSQNSRESSEVDPHAGKMCSNNGMISLDMSRPNGCQLLISSIYNLSKVLLTNEHAKCGNASEPIDVDALENSICILSDCLLKRSSDNLSKTSHELIVKAQEKFQEQLQDRNVCGKHANEADVHEVSEDQGCLQKCTISALSFTQPATSAPNQKTSFPVETTFPCACVDGTVSTVPSTNAPGKNLQDIVWERDREVVGLKDHSEEAESLSIEECLEEPFKQLLELQDQVLKLKEDIAYERSENNVTVSIYKRLWRQAQDELNSCRLDVWKTKSELEGLKKMLRNYNLPGGSDIPDCKDLEARSLDGMQDLDHEGLRVQEQSFGKVDSKCCLDLNSISDKVKDDALSHGSWETQVQVVEEGCASIVQVDRGNASRPNLNATQQWKDEAALAEDRETQMNWDTQMEIICLNPSKKDKDRLFLAEGEWEHIPFSWYQDT